MRSAETVLRKVDAGLDLPPRRRVALLRELRTDLADLVEMLVAEGYTPEMAFSRALALLVPTGSDLTALTELHRPAYVRVASRLPSRYARRLELMGVGAMALVATLMPLIALSGVAGLPGWAGTALGCAAALLVAHLTWHGFRILVREDADAAGLIHAGVVQAGLVGLTLATGALATAIGAYLALGSWAARTGVPGLASSLASCAEIAALTLSLAIFGTFGAVALFRAHLATRGVEEELGRVLAAVPVLTRDDRS